MLNYVTKIFIRKQKIHICTVKPYFRNSERNENGNWHFTINNCKSEERKMYQGDDIIDDVKKLIFNVNTGSSSEFSIDIVSDLDFE